MDLSNLLSGSDNFFKYMTIGGFIMIIIGLVYPLQKQQELELEVATYNKDVELFNIELKDIYSDMKKLKSKSSTYIYRIDNLKKTGSPKANIEKIKTAFNKSNRVISSKYNEIKIKNEIIKYNKNRITILERHLNTYRNYSVSFLLIGTFLSFIFGIRWLRSTILDENLKKKELRRP